MDKRNTLQGMYNFVFAFLVIHLQKCHYIIMHFYWDITRHSLSFNKY